ncbi:MAG: hypothetical protein RIQ53_4392, partial [Pseudomonadota bacterium]
TPATAVATAAASHAPQAVSPHLRAWKLAKRHDSDISAVACGLWLALDTEHRVVEARLAWGGLAATVRRAARTEAALLGRLWDEAALAAAQAALAEDFQPLSDLRATDAYRLQGARALLRRLWLETRAIDPLPAAGTTVWAWPLDGPRDADPGSASALTPLEAALAEHPPGTPAAAPTATTATAATPVIGRPLPHESAALHVAGRAPYIDDLPELAGTLHGALLLSPIAHGRLLGVDKAALLARPGVVAVYVAADIPGTNDCGPVVHDDPLLADGELRHVGQPVALVVARTRDQARAACAQAGAAALRVERVGAPLLDARSAHAAGAHVLPSLRLARGDAAAARAAAPQRLQGTFSLGGQEQFYLEGQISYALPQEDGGMLVHCSTQHPSEMQHVVAHVLGLAAHRVQVQCRRMGGGFGGKESQSALFAGLAALAAADLQCPVKLRPDRDDDFAITGRRHGFEFDVDAGFDDEGRLQGVSVEMIANAGHSADLSAAVVSRALCHFDNAYWLGDVAMAGHMARTHTQSNTAFRGFGGPQGALAIEYLLDGIARRLGRDPLDVRRANFYGQPGEVDAQGRERCVTPYGQRVEDNIIDALVSDLEARSAYRARRAEIDAFNAGSPVLKRGLALTPVKFGISFNVAHLNQAGAQVHIYTDGSVLVNHGGTEMGQGLNTKVAMVVAEALGLPQQQVRCTATDTQKVANTSATAASTGADLNGKAAQAAALTLRGRLAAVAAAGWGVAPEAVRFADGRVTSACGSHARDFADLVNAAYLQRVQLWSDGFYATPGLHWDRTTLTGHPFYYYAWGAAVSEVLVDTLTGEHRLLRADLLHDVGASLNPALDIGQVEGAYIQGMGWLTMEELWWQPDDGSPAGQRHAGRLMTHAPSTYKIPTALDCPPQFNVALWDGRCGVDTVHRSKAVGEPPLLLGFSAFFAIRDAIAAAAGPGAVPPLRAPATPEAVLDALAALRVGTPLRHGDR